MAIHRAATAAAVCFLIRTATACLIPDIHPIPPIEPRPPAPPPIEPIQTRTHKAEIRIEGAAARVSLAATFHNPNGFRAEGTYFFPIDPGAVVKEFSMKVNGQEQKAELLEAEKARQVYEDIVRRMKDPGLLEYVGAGMLKARVFPIEPRSDIEVRLSYTQVVRAEAGLFHFRYPLRSAKPLQGNVGQIALRCSVASATPIKLFHSPSHKIDTVRKDDRTATGGFEQSDAVPDRDFDIYWSVNEADMGVSVVAYKPRDEDGYCMISLTPKVELQPGTEEPKDIVFVFDRSGSMAGDKIRQARNALSHCLGRLSPVDRFSVIVFSTETECLTAGLIPATTGAVSKARDEVARVDARGGTAIHEALQTACRQISSTNRLAILAFLTDGKPTIGEVDIQEILTATRKANGAGARLFVFGVGVDVNTDLLDRLAIENRGAQDYVGEKEDIEVRVSAFYDKIASPVLSDVKVEAPGVKWFDVYPRQVPDVFRGGQVLLFGRYRGEGKQSVVARGKAGGRDHAFECEADFAGRDENDFIPAVWANRKVAFLMEQIRLHGKQKELEDEVVTLGKRYGIVTPYTSFLIVDDKAAPRPEVSDARRRLNEMKSGFDGVLLSRNLAFEKEAAAAPAAPGLMGFADASVGGGVGWFAGSDRAEAGDSALRAAVKQRVRRIADKTFYLRDDGFYYDSAFEEKDRPRMIEVASMSEDYFRLLNRHKSVGKYLAAKARIVLCIDGVVYRIGG